MWTPLPNNHTIERMVTCYSVHRPYLFPYTRYVIGGGGTCYIHQHPKEGLLSTMSISMNKPSFNSYYETTMSTKDAQSSTNYSLHQKLKEKCWSA